MSDAILRELLRNAPNPVKKLAPEQLQAQGQWLAALSRQRFIETGERIVKLECGHYVLSRSLHKAACKRCGEMIRSGYDHDGFRRLGVKDEFHWPEDPLRAINEGDQEDCSQITRPSANAPKEAAPNFRAA